MTSGCRMGGCDSAHTEKGKAVTKMRQARSDEICRSFFPSSVQVAIAGRQTDRHMARRAGMG